MSLGRGILCFGALLLLLQGTPRLLGQPVEKRSRALDLKRVQKTVPPLPADSFDIRKAARLGAFRASHGKQGNRPAFASEPWRNAADALAERLSAEIGAPVRLTLNSFGLPKTVSGESGALSSPSRKEPVEIARKFLRDHRDVFRFTDSEIDNLRLSGRSTSSGATHLHFHQTLNGVDVFHGVITILLDPAGQVVQAGAGEAVPQLRLDTSPRLTVEQAVGSAVRLLGSSNAADPLLLPVGDGNRTYFRNPFGDRHTPLAASLVIFPMSADSARLAYRIYVEKDRSHSYEMLLDANDGRLLYRQNLYHSAGKANVWKESPLKGPRELVDLPDEWLAPGAAVTTGNNVDAYLDADSDDEPDTEAAANIQDGRAFAPDQVFDFLAGEGSTNQDPTQFKAASVTNLFYFVNVAHDYFYGLGFDEAAGNFQTDNFERGGQGNDAVRAEAQEFLDGLGRFVTQPEGMPPRMEISLIPSDNFDPDEVLDGDFDGQLVLHEYTHGVADRLVGGPGEVSCLLGSVQGSALAEGWSDYFAISFFDNPVLGAYISRNPVTGLRRQSYEGSTLTFEDLIDEGFEPHNDGEIWASALWDLRKALGQSVAEPLVMGALKSTVCRPTMLDARDAILNADKALNAGANQLTIWETFARRGMGYTAFTVDERPGFLTVFNAAFDLPPALQTGNRGPRVTSMPPEMASLNDPLVYQVKATDPDGDPLTYELAEGPEGMTINASTGRLEWTVAFTGQRVKVAVTDGKGGRLVHGFYLAVISFLSAEAPVTISAKKDSVGIAVFDIPGGKEVLQVSLRGGSGDADLELLDPTFEHYGFSFENGSNETLSVAGPAAGFWAAYVYGASDYSGVSLAAGFPVPELLPMNAAKENLSGETTSETFYKVVLPPGAGALRVTTTGGTGDVDLYVRRGQVAVCGGFLAPCDVDDGSAGYGNDEFIEIRPVQPGDWFITLNGYVAYSGVALSVSVTGPEFSADGIVSSASFSKLLAPGGIFSIFGTNLAMSELSGLTIPLPTQLGSTSVKVNGVLAPLYYAGPTQINAQMPYEVQPGEATVEVTLDQLTSTPAKVFVGPAAPSIFQFGVNRAVVQNADLSVNDTDRPAAVGSFIVAYLTGIGPLDNGVATGEAASSDPLSRSTSSYSATIGGTNAEVRFLGLVPGLVGLAQANIVVPNVAPGDHPLEITVGGVVSNAPLITVSAN